MTAPRQTPNAEKREILDALLSSGAMVRIRLDARHPDVEVPAHLRADNSLLLEIGYNMPNPIADLDLGPDGIDMTLSFNLVPEPVFVPWEALYAAQAPAGYAVWAASVPPELLTAAAPAPATPSAPAPSGATVIDLMSRRTTRDARAVSARLAAAKVTAPGPRGGSAA
jgi:stringent starvation protein B